MKSIHALCLLALLLTSPALPAEEIPAGIRQGYQKLGEVIRTGNMPEFMKLFHRDFIYEASDGAAKDRGLARHWSIPSTTPESSQGRVPWP